MLYKLLNILFRITQFFYFKKVCIEGVDKINFKEANLLISNHPSAFKDPILIGSNFTNPIYFLAAEEFMGGKKTAVFLENQFNMIPIYRPTTRPDEIHKNTGSFEKCYEALNDKKSILIFAEGHSETQSWLDPLKTGTARIAIETLGRYPNLQKVNIVPVGLNYSNPHKFRSTFHLKIGDIIEVKQNIAFNKTDLTEIAYQHLRLTINGLEQQEANWQQVLVDIVKSKLDSDLSSTHQSIGKFILELNYLDAKNKDVLKNRTIQLVSEIEQIKESTKDYIEFKNFEKKNLTLSVLAILLFVPGFLFNLIPIYAVKLFEKSRDVKYSFEGSIKFTFGTVFLIGWHILFVTASFFMIGWYSFLLPLVILILGLITLVCRDYVLPIYKFQRAKSRLSQHKNISEIYLKIESQLKPIIESIK